MMKKNELNVMIELFKTNVMTNKSKSHDAVNFYERSTTVRPQVVFPQVVFHKWFSTSSYFLGIVKKHITHKLHH